jgi:hypothetical protein
LFTVQVLSSYALSLKRLFPARKRSFARSTVYVDMFIRVRVKHRGGGPACILAIHEGPLEVGPGGGTYLPRSKGTVQGPTHAIQGPTPTTIHHRDRRGLIIEVQDLRTKIDEIGRPPKPPRGM